MIKIIVVYSYTSASDSSILLSTSVVALGHLLVVSFLALVACETGMIISHLVSTTPAIIII
jgi:hypothetical protein